MAIKMILVQEYCSTHDVAPHFINELNEQGLLQLHLMNDQPFIAHDDLPHVEQLLHLHYDLDINLAGIEAILHLQQRLEEMQQRIIALEQYKCLYSSTFDDEMDWLPS